MPVSAHPAGFYCVSKSTCTEVTLQCQQAASQLFVSLPHGETPGCKYTRLSTSLSATCDARMPCQAPPLPVMSTLSCLRALCSAHSADTLVQLLHIHVRSWTPKCPSALFRTAVLITQLP